MYEIDGETKMLLAVAEFRGEPSFRYCLDSLGDRFAGVKYVCSDMWRPYLNVIADKLGYAFYVLDRFMLALFSSALVEVRAEEANLLVRVGYEPVLKKLLWFFLKPRRI